jgi:hypothetical protein
MIDTGEGFHYRSCSYPLVIAILGLVFSGCDPDSSQPAQSDASSKSKSDSAYPLKIVLVESGLLQSEIELRWQAFSDQGLKIQTMNRQEFATQAPTTADLLIYPANLMGTLVARDWIAPVPKQVKDRIGGWGISTETTTWSTRWRTLSTYGGKPMAVPLGAPSWVAITRSLDISPLRKLHERILNNELTKENSQELWDEFLIKAESVHQGTQAEREADLQRRIGELTPEAKRYLVHRYLWMISSTESRYRGLFDMHKLVSRCNQPEFARAAIQLRRLGVLQPSAIFASPTDAWQSVAEGSALFGLGWPRTDNEQSLSEETVREKWELVPLVWNDGSGLMASIGGRTRQSANATEFLIWLAAEDQRIAIQTKTPTVELLEIEDDRNRVREDYRDYQTLQRSDPTSPSMELTPRFFESDRFLELLEDTLIDVFRAPENAQERLERCRRDWDALVEQIGREKLRSSLEAASGYAQ